MSRIIRQTNVKYWNISAYRFFLYTKCQSIACCKINFEYKNNLKKEELSLDKSTIVLRLKLLQGILLY